MGKNKQKIVLPPELPPEVPDEEVEISDDDVQFVTENREYASLLKNLDTKSIDKHVTRIADVKEDAVEALYEERTRKRSRPEEKEEDTIEVDRVDALPVKTLDGKLYYRTLPKEPKKAEGKQDDDGAVGDGDTGGNTVKLSKAEKRAKLKKMRKEAKKQGKEGVNLEEVHQTPQTDVLDEVRKDLTVEEDNERKKYKLAELGTALLMDPETNIKSLKEMMQISKDGDHIIVTLGLKSLLAVFKDIIPGYRIRLPTEKEQEMKVSKTIKKMRFYESTLLSSYKAYVQKLIALEKHAVYKLVAMRCICTLLEAVPHFNFRENLVTAVVRNISSQDDIVRKLCCGTIKSLFTNEGKHGGEVTVEAVQMIANLVKTHDCQLHPDSIEVLLSLSFDEDLGKPEPSDADNKKNSKKSKTKNFKELNHASENEKKKTRQEMMSKTREEINAELKAASFAKDVAEQRRMQSETLSAVFEIFFRVLKHAIQPRSETNASPALCGHPLLAPCLKGIGKYSHLIDLDFMSDLLKYLRKLAGGVVDGNGSAGNSSTHLTVTERLQCCIVAFRVMRNNLDALNVDLQHFFVQLYNLIIEYRPGRDQGEILAEALKIMLCDDRQHDMQRAAAFIKRLATFSLCFGSAESMAALVTLKHLLQKNVKCRNLLENDAGGGSVSGAIAKYHPYASDPNLSGALASVLWELNLLSKHYHPAVSTMASGISMMSVANNQVLHSKTSPQQAFMELSLEKESFIPEIDSKRPTIKRKKGAPSHHPVTTGLPNLDLITQVDQTAVSKKLSEHFLLIRDITENERLRGELDRTTSSLELFEQFRKQKRRKTK
nr:nucleolar complex protein 3 homolog [Ipomoea batatas]